MIALGEAALVAMFAAFCRIGLCLAFAPGFSSPRIPMRVRLLIAVGLTIALAPTLLVERDRGFGQLAPAELIRIVGVECLTGASLGLLARAIFGALETLSVAAAMSIGVASTLAPRIDENESMPEFATFIVFAATALVFYTDLHWEILRGVAASFESFPLGQNPTAHFALDRFVAMLSASFVLALRIVSPFIAYGLLVNLGFGLMNKVVPQIPVYFVSAPFIILGGLVLFYFSADIFMRVFLDGFAALMERG